MVEIEDARKIAEEIKKIAEKMEMEGLAKSAKWFIDMHHGLQSDDIPAVLGRDEILIEGPYGGILIRIENISKKTYEEIFKELKEKLEEAYLRKAVEFIKDTALSISHEIMELKTKLEELEEIEDDET